MTAAPAGGRFAVPAICLAFASGCSASGGISLRTNDAGCPSACATGLICQAGLCAPETCTQSTDCSSPLQCIAGFCADVSCNPPCADNTVCLAQVCIPTSSSSTSSTSSCSAPYVACTTAGALYCANTETDSSNCGACGNVCPPGTVCNGTGVCTATCVSGETLCSGRCTDLDNDDQSCGTCGNTCPAGQACSGGSCAATCAAPYTTCGSGSAAFCANLSTDPSNCGSCGGVCAAGAACIAGSCAGSCPSPFTVCSDVCTDTRYDPNNCGGCGEVCASGDCALGSCETPGVTAASGGLSSGTSATSGTTSSSASATATAATSSTSGASGTGSSGAATSSSTGGVTLSTLSLLAGQTGGPRNVDGPFAAATFNYPEDVVYAAGAVYVADQENNAIREIDLDSGVVSTFAGGVQGSADGIGSQAEFYFPSGVSTDGLGNLYVADFNNATIRRIDVATAQVTTIAGTALNYGAADGTGAAASFSALSALANDDGGNLYVSDCGNNNIRKIDLGTFAVTTLAGTLAGGSNDGLALDAGFNCPGGLAFDGVGGLFIADTGNDTIRRLDLTTALVTTLAGSPGNWNSVDDAGAAAAFRYPQGVVYDGVGKLYITDVSNSDIRVLQLSNDLVSTFAGAAANSGYSDGTGDAATLAYPQGITFDDVGHLYVADSFNNVVRPITVPGAAVSTIGVPFPQAHVANGSGSGASFLFPDGIASDSLGNLFVSDQGSGEIRQIVIDAGLVSTLAGNNIGTGGANDGTGTGAKFGLPVGLTADDAGSVYIADEYDDTLRQLVVATTVVTTIAGSHQEPGSTNAQGTSASFNNPVGVVWDGQGDLYITDQGNNTIRKLVLANGEVSTLAGNAGVIGGKNGKGAAASFDLPSGITYDGNQTLYVVDTAGETIRSIDLATQQVATLAGTYGVIGSRDGTGPSAQFYLPQAIAYDGSGSLYVADTGNSTVRRIEIATGKVTTVIGVAGQATLSLGPVPASVDAPEALTFGPGNSALYILTQSVVLTAQ